MTRSTELPSYRILVEGLIDPNWSDCLSGLAIKAHERSSQPPVTELRGPLKDQAALQGVLDTLFMLNMPVLLVERDSADS
jgi:hypothetical protein